MTVACQGFQSCYETQQAMEPAWSLSLKLNPLETVKNSQTSSSSNSTTSGWSCIESLSLQRQDSTGISKEVYVHPLLVKQASSKLSNKSLEMCTESLGCETGTDMLPSNFFLSSSSSVDSKTHQQVSSLAAPTCRESSRSLCQPGPAVNNSRKSTKFRRELPPPLTWMASSSGRLVQPHRESGRLVMTMVSTSPARRSNLKAERSNGRLRMSLVKDYTEETAACSDEEVTTDIVKSHNEMERCGVVKCGEEGEIIAGDTEREEGAKEDDDDDDDDNVEEDEELEVVVKIGTAELNKPSNRNSCNHTNRTLINLDTFWVAISS